MPPTLPGDIDGLLRRGSPVLWGREAGWTYLRSSSAEGDAVIADDGVEQAWSYDLRLDLSDPSGRAHAGWYADKRIDANDLDQPQAVANVVGCSLDELSIVIAWAMGNRPMSDEQIDILRRIVLHIAGRTF